MSKIEDAAAFAAIRFLLCVILAILSLCLFGCGSTRYRDLSNPDDTMRIQYGLKKLNTF